MLFDMGESWEEEWNGMPEFVQEDHAPFKTLIVHFEKREDMDAFAKLVKQRLTFKTLSIWFPEAEIERWSKRYTDGTEVELE